MNLSKSLYTRGLQCSKSLWLKKNKVEVLSNPSTSQKAAFETGDVVGELACELFPNGKEIPFDGTTFKEKIDLTQKWLKEGIKNIYEATFEYDGILVIVDILHINDNGSVEIYEVKSSTSVKDIYLDDASIQYYVLNGLGYDIKKVSIVHINNKYVRANELEIDKLFTIADVSTEVLELQADIPIHLKHFRNQLSKKNEPDIDIGKQCNYPYECDAKEYCWKHIPNYSIFDISRLRTDKKFDMYNEGIVKFEQITNIDNFSKSQQIQIESQQQNKTIINKKAIKKFLDGLTYPIYHLDFETFQQAVPEWKGIIPFMQIPFQYSLHIENKNNFLEHKEFLALQGVDPRYELAKRLVADIPGDVTVLAYNMVFEKEVIKKLAGQFDKLYHPLMKIYNNIQDLMTPFQNKDYYTPKMRGSYSIKSVLPALVPDMQDAYSSLLCVQNGVDAMQLYPSLSAITDMSKLKNMRNSLLKYCELDTLSMVKILEVLHSTCQNEVT